MSITSQMQELRDEIDADAKLNIRENMMLCKKEIIDFCFKKYRVKTVAELGCVWGVEGVYGRYIAEKHPHTNVVMVDTHWTEEARMLCSTFKNIRIISDNFANAEMPGRIGKVDAIILFDVLLHQVAPDWDFVLQMYAPYTNLFLICQPQYSPPHYTMQISTRLLDLGCDRYFENVPHDKEHPTYKNLFDKMFDIHPEHNKIWRDVHHVWQWGITDADLLHKMQQLSFRPIYMKNEGVFMNDYQNWENVAFVFEHNM